MNSDFDWLSRLDTPSLKGQVLGPKPGWERLSFCTSGAGGRCCQTSLGFRREYWQLKGGPLGGMMNPVPDLTLEAGSSVRPGGGARGRRRADVRDQFLQAR